MFASRTTYTAVKPSPNSAASISSTATAVSARRFDGHEALAGIEVRLRSGRRLPSVGDCAPGRAKRHEQAKELRQSAHASSPVRSPIRRATITSASRPMNQATIPSGIGPML